MTIKDMHYDLKKKINKTDSQKYKNLLVPEIDWTLNEAAELYIKMILQPKLQNFLGSSFTQRTLDDIYPIIRHEKDPENCYQVIDNVSQLPYDFWYYLSSYVTMSKGSCQNVEGKVFIRQHDDEFERSSFDFSSFKWRTVNAIYFENGIRFYTNDFTVEQFCISYIKRMKYMHNAEDFRDNKYALPSGQILGITSGGGKITINTVASTSAGTITITIEDGTNSATIPVEVLFNSSKTMIISAIIKAINKEATFEAYPSNTEDYTIIIGGTLPITTVSFVDTDTTGVTTTTQQNVETGEATFDCELPPHTHREIVDLAAKLITGEMGNVADYQFKQDKLNMDLNIHANRQNQ